MEELVIASDTLFFILTYIWAEILAWLLLTLFSLYMCLCVCVCVYDNVPCVSPLLFSLLSLSLPFFLSFFSLLHTLLQHPLTDWLTARWIKSLSFAAHEMKENLNQFWWTCQSSFCVMALSLSLSLSLSLPFMASSNKIMTNFHE